MEMENGVQKKMCLVSKWAIFHWTMIMGGWLYGFILPQSTRKAWGKLGHTWEDGWFRNLRPGCQKKTVVSKKRDCPVSCEILTWILIQWGAFKKSIILSFSHNPQERPDTPIWFPFLWIQFANQMDGCWRHGGAPSGKVVVSNSFLCSPRSLGKWFNLTNSF